MALTTSERIKLIAEIARRLSTEEWSLVDLTLSQFMLPTTDLWSRSKYDYVLDMVSSATNDVLVLLANHVGFEVSSAEVGVDPPFWKDSYLRVFLSHLSEHREFAANLQTAFEIYGLTAFVAHNDIEPAKQWQDEIETALSTCEVLVALMHEGFDGSNWTDQEVGFAMGRGVPVFSVRLGQDPYGFIGKFQAFNGNGKSAELLAKEIFDSVRAHKQTQRRMAEILVGRFEQSYSFHNAKENMGFLEELASWDSSYSHRIQKAAETNSQIAQSFGVPGRVAKLVAAWTAKGA